MKRKMFYLALALCWSVILLGEVARAADTPTKLRILLTNDDGIEAEGLIALAKEIRTLEAEVTVVAPAEDKSGFSHSLTYREPFRVEEVKAADGQLFGYGVNGTPADAALLGIRVLMAKRPPDLVISGINRGENLGAVAHLSGTVGAAMEATTLGIPAIAVSMGRAPQMDYSYAAKITKAIALAVRKNGLPKGTCLNVNVPGLPEKEIKGLLVVPQSNWRGEIRHQEGKDLFGRPYFWRGFSITPPHASSDTDAGAFYRGFVTITPIKLDWTDHEVLKKVKKWEMGAEVKE